MAIQQTIQFKSDHKYFAGFLQNLIDQSQINASVTMIGKTIELIIDENDTNKLEDFSNTTNKYLPNSIFLGDIKTSNTQTKIIKERFLSPNYPIAPCQQCLEAICNPASDDYLNDSYSCTHYSNEIMKNSDFCSYSVHYSDGMTLLLTNANKVNELFYLSELEIKALFSIEKPSIKVTIKDERLKEVVGGKNFIYIRTPYSIKSNIVALNAKESEIDYLFFDETDNKKCVIVKDNISFIRDNPLSKQLETLHKDNAINRVLNLEIEARFKGSIAANMSRKDGINFIVSNEIGIKRVLQFQEFDVEQLIANMQSDTLKSRMLENFKTKYPQAILNLVNNKKATLFEAIATILELDTTTFEGLSDKAYEFRGNGGVKIDMYFTDDGFDFVSLFGSIMSFKLANTDTHFLAYSIFEAFGDMIISTCNQLKTKFKIENFIMMGDMFENSVIYSRILSKFQLQKPYFSSFIALDE
ncbi:MAG: hydrogenase [Campylobacterales bacterium]|nr:hydrogenase [Campylobacterales bacterium]